MHKHERKKRAYLIVLRATNTSANFFAPMPQYTPMQNVLLGQRLTGRINRRL